MCKLEVAKGFLQKIIDCSCSSDTLKEIFDDEFFVLEDQQQTLYLSNLLEGLMRYEVSPNVIGELFRQLMRMDDYCRCNMPIAHIENSVILECTGSGKKPYKTLNISTPSIITAVAAGAKIIKKGSSATSSIIGSSDLIYGLGFNSDMTNEEREKLLYETGFTFVDIEKVIPRFDFIYGGYFFKPHILSLVLAAQVTSLRGNKILYGLSNENVKKSCETLKYLETEENITVYTSTENEVDFFDELIGSGNGMMSRCCNGVMINRVDTVNLDLPSCMTVVSEQTREKSVNKVIDILRKHESSEYLNIIVYNAGFYLYEAGLVGNISEGKKVAEECILSNKVYEKLLEIIECSGGRPSWIER